MSEPSILANQNLIVNGEFEFGLDNWVRGPTNPRGLVVQSMPWSADPEHLAPEVMYLSATDQASASQILRVPKALATGVRYVLCFYHEAYNELPGRLLIERLPEGGDKLELPLTPTHPSLTDEQLALLESGQLAEFDPLYTNVELNLGLNEGDELRVSIFSPRDPGCGIIAKVHVARLRLQLHLPPLQLQEMLLDGVPRVAGGPLYLCYGAEASVQHQLAFVPHGASPWLGTSASLTVEGDVPEAIVALPEWGKDAPLADSWLLSCPAQFIDEPQWLTLILRNQYNAEAFSVPVSLGHHRLAVGGVEEARHYLVLGQETRVGIQVISYYTRLPLPGREVTWSFNGQPLADKVTTDQDGWAYLTYEPKIAGNHQLSASAQSLFEPAGLLTHDLPVRVLATDPWLDALSIDFGQPSSWAEKTGYPNRGSEHPVILRLPANSPLIGTELSLYWEGVDADELGVTVNPALEQPVLVTGTDTEWRLTCDDRLDGQFRLLLKSSRLLNPSAPKRMSLARNLVRIGESRLINPNPVVDEQESVLVRVQVEHLLWGGRTGPVVNALVDWELPRGSVSTVTGAGGWASVLYTPTEAGAFSIKVKVRAHAEMAPIDQDFAGQAMASSPWTGQARFYLDDGLVDLAVVGVVCRRGGQHTFRVAPTAGSPVAGRPMVLRTDPSDSGGLVIGTPSATADGGWAWPISSEVSSSRSQLFDWTLTCDAINEPRRLAGRLLLRDLAEEVSITLDQVPAHIGDRLYPCLGEYHRFTVLSHALSPLVGLNAQLTWTGTPAEQLQASIAPPLDQSQAFSDGGAIWRLDFTASQQAGEFALTLDVPQLAQQVPLNPNAMELGHNKVRIETLNTPEVDPVVGEDATWVWARVVSAFNGQPVAQVPVRWTAQGQSSTVDTDAAGWSGLSFTAQSADAQEIEAWVLSRYDGHESRQSTVVEALPSDPWQDLRVSFDGLSPVPWGTRTCFPRRKGSHSFIVTAQNDSALEGRELSLGMTGTGPSELGMRLDFESSLGRPRSFYGELGLRYQFTVDDVTDGSYGLRFSASKLARLSPANAMSQGSGSQVVSFQITGRANQVLDWGQVLEEQVTVISSISGKPMMGVTVIWRSPELGEVSTVTNFYGVARVRYRPRVPGITTLTATAGEEGNSQTLALPFTLNEPREIRSLVYTPASGATAEMASATVVSALSGEPLANVEVMWELQGIKLNPTLTGSDGVARLSATGLMANDGLLIAYVKGGRGGGWAMASTLVGNALLPAKIATLTASPNPAQPYNFITFTAVIFGVDTGEVLPNRQVYVRFDNENFVPSNTNSKGEIIGVRQALSGDRAIEFSVQVKNTFLPTQFAQITVPIYE